MLNEIEEYQAVALRPYPDLETCQDPLWKARYTAMWKQLDRKTSLTGISRPMLLVARRFLYEESLYQKETTWQERYLAARYALYGWSGFPIKADDSWKDLPAFSEKGKEELAHLQSWFPNALQVMERGKAEKPMSEKWAKQLRRYQNCSSIPYSDIKKVENNPSRLPRMMKRIAGKMPKANEITIERILAAASDEGPLRSCCLCIRSDFRNALYHKTKNANVRMCRDNVAGSNYAARVNQIYHLIAMILMCSVGDYVDCVSSLKTESEAENATKDEGSLYAPILQADFGNWCGKGRPDKYFTNIVRESLWLDGKEYRKIFLKKETDANKSWLRLDPAFQRAFGISLVPADAPLEEEVCRYSDKDLFVEVEKESAPATVQMGKKKKRR